MNDINFTGGFWFENPGQSWNRVVAELPTHSCIVENVCNEGDKLLAVKSLYDRNIARVVLSLNTKIKYYPNINLKSRLDPYLPQEARKIIDAETEVFETEDEIRQYLRESNRPFLISRYRWKPDDHIDKTYKALGLNVEEYPYDIEKGVTYIKNKNGEIIAKASPNDNKGINYVYKYPKNNDESSQRFALAQGGEIVPFGPLQTIDFQKRFTGNVKIDAGRMRPKKNK